MEAGKEHYGVAEVREGCGVLDVGEARPVDSIVIVAVEAGRRFKVGRSRLGRDLRKRVGGVVKEKDDKKRD